MNRRFFKIIIILNILLFPLIAKAEWTGTIQNDEMTDEKIGIVTSPSVKGANWIGKPYSIIVRCKSSNYLDLDVYIYWGEFVSDHASNFIQLRFDKDPMLEVSSNPSKDGSSSFLIDQKDIDNVIMSMRTKSVMRAKTTDYRQASTQVGIFSLNGFAPTFEKTCGWWLNNVKNESVDPYVKSEVTRWGPKNIIINKKILKSIGKYSGLINADINVDYIKLVSSVYYQYLDECQKGSVTGTICTSYRIMIEYAKPPVSAVFYELSSGELKAEAGKLKITD